MKKCPKCGKEFEGSFCPDCGERWQEEKTCPQCGATLAGATRFCNECGYAFYESTKQNKSTFNFKEKLNTVWAWMKSHLKIVIPVASAVLLVIILSCAIPAGIANANNGTYYKLSYNGEVDKSTYFILKSGKWEDEDGETGTYKKDGDNIIFYYTFMGATEELCSGTLKDKVLKVNDDTFISEKHKHKYGEWETARETTCTADGVQARTCFCGVNETEKIPAKGHQGEWEITKEPTCKEEGFQELDCTICGQHFEKEIDKLPHKFGEWEITQEATCIAKGVNTRICKDCSFDEEKAIDELPHELSDWIFDYNNHYKMCSNCDERYYYANHGGENICNICNYPLTESVGLSLSLNDKEDGYIVMGLGTVNTDIIRIPETYNNLPIVSIADNAFRNCSTLKYVIISKNVLYIGASSFSGCSALTNVIMPRNLISIGSSAFRYCDSLLEITIPEGVISIGAAAFDGCTALNEINFNAINCSDFGFPNYVFGDAGMSGPGITVNFGSLVSRVPAHLFFPYNTGGSNVNIKKIIFPENSVCESIGSYAFRDCEPIISIVLPKSVNSIGYDAFRGPLPEQTPERVLYMGTYDDWGTIEINETNTKLLNALLYYYSLNNPYIINPNDEKLYWHYEDGEVVIWKKEN